jgi:hypothetical protein
LHENIDIIDNAAYQEILTSNLQGPAIADVVQEWRDRHLLFLKFLGGQAWKTIDFIGLGFRKEHLRLTIIIGASDADSETWDDTVTAIGRLFEHGIDVQFLHGEEELETSELLGELMKVVAVAGEEESRLKGVAYEADDVHISDLADFSATLIPGSSVGRKSGHSRSIGRFLTVRLGVAGGPEHRLLLLCWLVLVKHYGDFQDKYWR